MEISFYVECFEQNEKFIPWCLKVDMKIVDFTFELSDDIELIETSEWWTNVESILAQSFGTMTVEISINKHQQHQMYTRRSQRNPRIQTSVINIKPIRQPSKMEGNIGENLEALLLDDKNACQKFIDTSGDNCWSEHLRQQFSRQGITFLGHKLTTNITEDVSNIKGTRLELEI